MDLQTLTKRLNSFSGFDLSDTEAADLINEAVRDLAFTSEFPRKQWIHYIESGNSGVQVPADFLFARSVRVNGIIYPNGSESDVVQFANGTLVMLDPGIWYITPPYYQNEREWLTVYPTPDDGSIVIVDYVFRPQALTAPTDKPVGIPEEFHPALLLYVAGRYYATVEDNAELSEQNMERYRSEAERLRRFTITQTTGNRPFRVGVEGYSA